LRKRLEEFLYYLKKKIPIQKFSRFVKFLKIRRRIFGFEKNFLKKLKIKKKSGNESQKFLLNLD